MVRKIFIAAAISASFITTAATAGGVEDRIRALAADQLSQWVQSATVIDAVREQNEKHAGLSQSDIDALDQAWRNQADSGSQPMIDDLLSRSVSEYLRVQQSESGGLITEVFIMDNHGLNVAQSDATSDYWQGDEAKFQKTFGAGSGTIFVDEVEFDDSSGSYQVQVSLTIDDPADGSPIGAVTFGIAME